MPDKEQWYVKTAGGAVYGPAVLERLVVWAQEGRIEPTSFISHDGVHWSPAPLKRELAMDWVVEVSVGRLAGPFHHDVAYRLRDGDRVPFNARMFCLYQPQPKPEPVVEPVIEPEVVEPVVEEPKPVMKVVAKPVIRRRSPSKGIFANADLEQLKALEMAARRELAQAKRGGVWRG